MKTSLHSLLLFALLFIFFEKARADVRFECLRDLIPITDRASIRNSRKGVETPFLLNYSNYVVFPEVQGEKLTGFFVYNKQGAWYYDAIEERRGKKTPIVDLKPTDKGVFELVAQPNGIETIAVQVLPGFSTKTANKDGPVFLGASVLPVVGAFVSRPEQREAAYANPNEASQKDMKDYLLREGSIRKPSSVKDVKVNKTLARLTTLAPKKPERLWEPLREEYRLRKNWIRQNNLDEQSFRRLTRIMDTTCANGEKQ